MDQKIGVEIAFPGMRRSAFFEIPGIAVFGALRCEVSEL
jgi:hypothetical protein